MEQELKFICQRRVAWDDYGLYLVNKVTKHAASPPLMVPYTPGEFVEPFVKLRPEEAEQLMTELWNAGVRPLGKTDAAISDEVNAVKYHLEDMRRLVFNK